MVISKTSLILGIVIFLVVGVNALAYLSLRKKNTLNEIELFRRASKRASRPWEKEENNLAELSRLVQQFKHPEDEGSNENQ